MATMDDLLLELQLSEFNFDTVGTNFLENPYYFLFVLI